MISQHELSIGTKGRDTYDLTADVQSAVHQSGVMTGMCHIFVRHTSASLMLCENADPAVRSDLELFMSRLVPDGDPDFEHTAEGADDMPAHIRSVLTQTGLTIPLQAGRADLGTWQGVYLWEHRQQGHVRRITLTVTD